MTNTTFSQDFASNFRRNYSFKMGGTQTVVMPNGQEFFFDDRQYYSGRGAKYNASIKHDNIGRVDVSAEQVINLRKIEWAEENRRYEVAREKKAAEKRYKANQKAGVYGLKVCEYGTFVELSHDEVAAKTFDSKRLAKTLGISVKDADLLNSEGKTYVFAQTIDGRTLELYHADLSCNNLSISVSEATPERLAEFNHAEWASAPYADLVGMTANGNHFVC